MTSGKFSRENSFVVKNKKGGKAEFLAHTFVGLAFIAASLGAPLAQAQTQPTTATAATTSAVPQTAIIDPRAPLVLPQAAGTAAAKPPKQPSQILPMIMGGLGLLGPLMSLFTSGSGASGGGKGGGGCSSCGGGGNQNGTPPGGKPDLTPPAVALTPTQTGMAISNISDYHGGDNNGVTWQKVGNNIVVTSSDGSKTFAPIPYNQESLKQLNDAGIGYNSGTAPATPLPAGNSWYPVRPDPTKPANDSDNIAAWQALPNTGSGTVKTGDVSSSMNYTVVTAANGTRYTIYADGGAVAPDKTTYLVDGTKILPDNTNIKLDGTTILPSGTILPPGSHIDGDVITYANNSSYNIKTTEGTYPNGDTIPAGHVVNTSDGKGVEDIKYSGYQQGGAANPVNSGTEATAPIAAAYNANDITLLSPEKITDGSGQQVGDKYANFLINQDFQNGTANNFTFTDNRSGSGEVAVYNKNGDLVAIINAPIPTENTSSQPPTPSPTGSPSINPDDLKLLDKNGKEIGAGDTPINPVPEGDPSLFNGALNSNPSTPLVYSPSPAYQLTLDNAQSSEYAMGNADCAACPSTVSASVILAVGGCCPTGGGSISGPGQLGANANTNDGFGANPGEANFAQNAQNAENFGYNQTYYPSENSNASTDAAAQWQQYAFTGTDNSQIDETAAFNAETANYAANSGPSDSGGFATAAAPTNVIFTGTTPIDTSSALGFTGTGSEGTGDLSPFALTQPNNSSNSGDNAVLSYWDPMLTNGGSGNFLADYQSQLDKNASDNADWSPQYIDPTAGSGSSGTDLTNYGTFDTGEAFSLTPTDYTSYGFTPSSYFTPSTGTSGGNGSGGSAGSGFSSSDGGE